MVLFNSAEPDRAEDKGNKAEIENIDFCFQQRFKDMIDHLEKEPDKEKVITGLKKLLSISVNSSVFYETVLIKLFTNLFNSGRYGEALYFYMLAPCYFDSVLSASQILARKDLKNKALASIFSAFKNNQQIVNVLLLNNQFPHIQGISDAIKIACNQQLYICTNHHDLLEHPANLIENYHLFIVATDYITFSLDCIKKFKDKFGNNIPAVLYCYTLSDAKKVHKLFREETDYIIYNDKMLYGLIHKALYSITP